MSTGTWVLVVAVVVALAFGGYRALTDGRFRGARAVPATRDGRAAPDAAPSGSQGTAVPPEPAEPSLLEGTPWVSELGQRATLLQFSSAFCAPCRATRRTLGEVVAVTPGVAHVEVDAEEHLDVVRRLGVLRTPTTIVLDRAGREVTRASGAPSRQQVLSALDAAVSV
ncbi:Thiol-disulfide isomerase or thioredoxin [Nocardioides scoriae]|uniref:Thiol-disulfide isomerase or thioredoxin n=1 Tax=Nocardioides scoriae TaxID=642780 RepID=A0A1H1WW24_9ACTN|nr:thioredoxin family protein [Nocardioides scoriae]SDT01383.1 Thiol-disulfide isomerase or thioredoxin [Nocardioides scoriae]